MLANLQVLERGVPLAEWLRTQRSPMAILNMFYDVAKQLVRVHDRSVVHRGALPRSAHIHA